VAFPWLSTVAIAEFEVLQVAVAVTSWVLPSVYVPVAFTDSCVPRANDGTAGVTAIETSAGWATTSEVEPEIEFRVATILAFPTPRPIARPVPSMLPIAGAVELQLTELVTSWVLLSV
jgi:hypothetical protein